MKRWIQAGCVVLAALSVGGCANSLTGETYSRSEAQRVQTVRMGQVIGVRLVVLQGTDTGVGTMAGGVIGGVAGSGVGQGRGSIVVGILGAVVGGVIGSRLEEGMTRAQGVELTVKLDNGEILAVVQQASPNESFAIGDRVRLLTSGPNTRVAR